MRTELGFSLLPRATLLAAGLALSACGGGDGVTYAPAKSASFDPVLAKATADATRNVPLHWVYTVNNGAPVTTTVEGISISLGADSIEISIDPADMKRRVVSHGGKVSGSSDGVSVSGDWSFNLTESLVQGTGTLVTAQDIDVQLNLSGGGESGTGRLVASTSGLTPPCEWFIDRPDLDTLAIGTVLNSRCSGNFSYEFTMTGEDPLRGSGAAAMDERWTVTDKLSSMTVQGKSYSNIVKLSRATKVPDFSGGLVPVTMTYWVAKGVGMVRGIGQFRLLDNSQVTYELVDTNLTVAP